MNGGVAKSIVIIVLILLLITSFATTLDSNAQTIAQPIPPATLPPADVFIQQYAINTYLMTVVVTNNTTIFAYDTIINNFSSPMIFFKGSQLIMLNITSDTLLQVFVNMPNLSTNNSTYFVPFYFYFFTYFPVQVYQNNSNTTSNHTTNTTIVGKMPNTPLALTIFNTAMLFGMLFWLAVFSYKFLSQNGKKRKYTKFQLSRINILPVVSIISGAVVAASVVEIWYNQGTVWYWIGTISSILLISVLYYFLFVPSWLLPHTKTIVQKKKSKKGGN